MLTQKDRLLCFGSELIISLCEEHNVEVVITQPGEHSQDLEPETIQEILEIVSRLVERLGASQSSNNRMLADTLSELIKHLPSP